MATELQDTKLLANLSSGDMDNIYTNNTYQSFSHGIDLVCSKSVGIDKLLHKAIAFAELVSYIEDITDR